MKSESVLLKNHQTLRVHKRHRVVTGALIHIFTPVVLSVARNVSTVIVGEKCVLVGWEISHEGRKHYTGTALFGESGTLGYATWFEVPNALNQKVS